MKAKSDELLKQALELPPAERATLVDRLLTSLDRLDDTIDKAWRREIAARLHAYRSGAAATVSADAILADTKLNVKCIESPRDAANSN